MPRDKSSDLVEDIFPAHEVHILGGAPGSGKSAFMAWMMSHILEGREFLGHATNPPPWMGVFIVDRDAKAQKQFWEAAGLGEVPYYCLTEDETLSPWTLAAHDDGKAEYNILLRGLDALKPPKDGCLIIDVANYFSGDSRASYNKGFSRGWAISKLARKESLTMFGVMHGGKQKKHDAYVRLVDRTIANSGFLGATSTLSYLASKEETDKGGLQDFAWQSHYAPSEAFSLKRTETGLYELAREVVEPATARNSERWDFYLNWIPMEGSGNSWATSQILMRAAQPDLNWSPRTVHRDLAQMLEQGLLVQSDGQRGRWQVRQRPKAEEIQ